MLRHVRRVVVGAFLALVVFAGAAAAECAWVLWSKITPQAKDDWEVTNTYQSESECKAAIARLVSRSDSSDRVGSNIVKFALKRSEMRLC